MNVQILLFTDENKDKFYIIGNELQQIITNIKFSGNWMAQKTSVSTYAHKITS